MSIGWQLASQITSLVVGAVGRRQRVHLSNRPRTTDASVVDDRPQVGERHASKHSDQRADLEVIAQQP